MDLAHTLLSIRTWSEFPHFRKAINFSKIITPGCTLYMCHRGSCGRMKPEDAAISRFDIRTVNPGLSDHCECRPPASKDHFFVHEKSNLYRKCTANSAHLSTKATFICTKGGRFGEVLLHSIWKVHVSRNQWSPVHVGRWYLASVKHINERAGCYSISCSSNWRNTMMSRTSASKNDESNKSSYIHGAVHFYRHARTRARAHTHTHTRAHARTHAHTHARTRACAHTHVRASSQAHPSPLQHTYREIETRADRLLCHREYFKYNGHQVEIQNTECINKTITSKLH